MPSIFLRCRLDFPRPTLHLALLLGVFLALSGCATFSPKPAAEVPFLKRVQTQQKKSFRVSVAVLSTEESRQVFGVPLAKKGVQAVWLEIENEGENPAWFIPLSLDPEYFSPREVAFMHHGWFSKGTNRRIDEHFEDLHLGMWIGAGSRASGFVYTRLDRGAKFVNVELLGQEGELTHFGFTVEVPGRTFDYHKVNFRELYREDEIVSIDLEGLRQTLKDLPCCATDSKWELDGDPLNLVIVGSEDAVLSTFVRRGWDLTESLGAGSGWRTAWSTLFGSRYRTSPVSPLFLFGRRQDVAFQKARDSIHQRNHLRLWLAPLQYEGRLVWVGQISRDIGVRFTTLSPILTTHKIDPDVDEARIYLLQDLLASGYVQMFGNVEGVGAADPDAPKKNLTGDPYFTDGFRLVLFVNEETVPLDQVEVLEWGHPVRRKEIERERRK